MRQNRKLLQKRNDSMNLLDRHAKIHRNCVKTSPGETDGHARIKFEISRALQEMGIEYVTEAIFKDRKGRADIFVLDNCMAIEIVGTETAESIEMKMKKYPCELVVVSTDKGIDAAVDKIRWLM